MRSSWFVVAVTLVGCKDPSPTADPQKAATQASSASPLVSAQPAFTASAPARPAAAASVVKLEMKPITLPGASGALSLDYLGVERAAGRVWVPAADTGSVDVIDASTGKVTKIEGFPTAEQAGKSGAKRTVGPSSVTLGESAAYVGNRANSEVCAIDLAKLTKGACVTLSSAPDGLAYIAATKQVWATTPKESSIAVLDASTPGKLTLAATVKLAGAPEGYAVDGKRGVFFTNLEDADKTVVIDVHTRKVTATWEPRCGSDGPRGLAFDEGRNLLFVACTDQVKVLDAEHAGAERSALPGGKGIDNIDYVESRGELFVAAGGGPGIVTVAHVDSEGALSVVASAETSPGVRNVVATANGLAFAADGRLGRILALTRPK